MRKLLNTASVLVLVVQPCVTDASTAITAFPGAEGAGRFALGGRGGRVFVVTSLADAGPGTLRAAIDAEGPRNIVFAVSGTIRLNSPLKIRNSRVTIAGQTAPGDGITLANQTLEVAADDVIVRFIRVRLGDESRTQGDAISITKGRRIILDHVSASWSVDETLSVSANYKEQDQGFYDVTVQWSIIAESLRSAGHAKGNHGYGSLVRGGRGARISFHHNLWANHMARMPRPGNYDGPEIDKEGPLFDFRSNVFYNWGGSHAGYNADKATLARYNFIDNAYVPGPDTKGRVAFKESNVLAKAWFAGNSMDGVIPADPWSLVEGANRPGYKLAAPIDVAPVAPDSAARAYSRVLAGAGASKVRDTVDKRIINGVRSRTGRIIDSQTEVGGWPELRSFPAPQDGDGDGMPDSWEQAHKLDPYRDDGAQDDDSDGWTNLEEYLNSLVPAEISR